MILDQANRLLFGIMQQIHHRLINPRRSLVGESPRLRDLLPKEWVILAFAQIDRADARIHAPARHHRAGQSRGAPDVVIGTGTHRAEQQLFRRPPGQKCGQLHPKIGLRQGVAVMFGQHMGAAKAAATRNDRHFVKRVGPRIVEGGGGMPGLVHRQTVLLVGLDRQSAHGAHHHLVARLVQIGGRDVGGRAARGSDRGLVQQVLQISPGKPRCACGDLIQIDIAVQRQALDMHVQDGAARALVGQRQGHVPVKPSGAQQGRIQHIGAVGGRQHHHRLAWAEPVQFRQDLVKRLFAFIMATAQTGAAGAPDTVQFIDEDDRRCLLAGLLEHLAHPARADTDEHLDEFRTGCGKEWHIGLAGQCPCQQRLAGAGWPHQQHAMRHRGPHLLETIRIAQKLDQLRHLALGLVLARDIGEGDLALRFRRFGRPPAQKITDPAGKPAADAAAGHPAAEPEVEGKDHDPWQKREQHRGGPRLQSRDDDALFLKQRHQRGVGLLGGDGANPLGTVRRPAAENRDNRRGLERGLPDFAISDQ